MSYPKIPDLNKLANDIELYTQLKAEYNSKNISPILKDAADSLKSALAKIKKLPDDKDLALKEPNSLKAIQNLRPAGPRRLWQSFDNKSYTNKLQGALLGRMAGCTLGSAVEFWPINKMQALAKENGDNFPPTDYWSYIPEPEFKKYGVSPYRLYTRNHISGVPVDDDIVYTLLGLLIAEDHSPNFTTEDVAKAWIKYLPHACTAEEIALNNLRAGISPKHAAVKNNPYCQWIGADIRADPFGYLAPGLPQRAAEMAYHDAYISHRRQGIYGEMFFAAAIAAAFATNDPIEALHIGLTEIPKQSTLTKAIKWAFKTAPQIKNYKQARDAVDTKFKGMHRAHTINNACLTVFGITIGKTDFTKVISHTVAMGLDNDCTAATAGSIVGAATGKQNIPKHWYKNFNNTIHSYLINKKSFKIDDVVKRFAKQAKQVHDQ